MSLALRAYRGLLAHKDRRVTRVTPAMTVHQARMGLKERRDLLVRLAHKVRREIPVIRVHKAPQVQQGLRV